MPGCLSRNTDEIKAGVQTAMWEWLQRVLRVLRQAGIGSVQQYVSGWGWQEMKCMETQDLEPIWSSRNPNSFTKSEFDFSATWNQVVKVTGNLVRKG